MDSCDACCTVQALYNGKDNKMGTDRCLAYRGPCPCGFGVIEVEFCTPDHPWPTESKWFEKKITCKKCEAKYAFEKQDNHYGLVDKREIREREKRYEAYKSAQTGLLGSPQAKDVVSKFIILLDDQPSMAACHRLLSSHQLVRESYGTFIKRWKGAEAWVKSVIDIHAELLVVLSEIVGVKDEYILDAVSELKRLWDEFKRPLPFHGDPLFDTSFYHD